MSLLASRRAALVAEAAGRRDRLGEELERRGVDALLISSESNFTYLTGYITGSWANQTFPLVLLFVPNARPWAIVGAGEVDSITQDGGDLTVLAYTEPHEVRSLEHAELDFVPDAITRVAEVLSGRGLSRLGVERSLPFMPRLNAGTFERLAELVPGLELCDAAPLLSGMRQRKSPLEISLMRTANDVLASSHELFAERAQVGMTERELHRLFCAAAAEAGADRVGFTGVIADARRASLGGPTDRTWDPGHLLVFDACVVVDGYWADFCRMYAAQDASAEQRQGYEQLVATLTEAREAVAPGRSIASVAQMLAGGPDGGSLYGRMGHGIGLDYTEPPSMHAREPGVFQPGMTVCLEPNRTVPGVGQLVTEEQIAVTEDGVELLSPAFPPELQVI